ncbi:Artemisinic aldehyde Delta(11(13)) reductase [Mycena venus]|uniref:Artemisinic aldehyde Delta(11(13)) reductase n=1 Tax=Mycena venus TaxID=2733690 RepID=A0A8H6XGN6_9AGAR|nr:Artemisinic aldehyde Delta(11(13)) reductase [Mycena venus]
MSSLFNPLQLGSTTISNRIGMSALTRNRSSGTVPNELMKEYYDQRAAGEAGLIISEGTLITRQGTEWQHAPGIWNDAQIAGWKKITDSVHALGSKMYCQLWHLGRLNHPEAPEQIASGEPVYAPSAIAARGGKFRYLPGTVTYTTPTPVPDPTILIAQYKQAAINAKKAGFDGVELQCANGYLPQQFLDSGSNKRTDKWGGSVENRARFVLETLKALIEVWGPNVAMKVAPATGNNDVGMPLQETIETFSYLFREADKLGLAYVTLMRYSELYDPERDGKRHAPRHDVLATYRPLLAHTNIFLNIQVTPELAEEVRGGYGRGKPLDNALDTKTLYGGSGVDLTVGYTDYKEAVY